MLSTEIIIKEALEHSPLERTQIIDALLKSFDEPDLKVDRIWAMEVKKRLEAFKAGKLETISEEEFFASDEN